MKIAICEDDLKMAAKIENLVGDCFSDANKYETEVFYSGETLIENLKINNNEYQLYLLDIELKEINGLEAAKYIRQHDLNAVIIFITTHVELMSEAFDVLAFHFLVKPIDEKKAKTIILRAIESLNIKKTVFQYSIRKRLYSIYLEQIEYFESFNRKIAIHCHDEVIEYYGNINEVLDKVDSNLFVQVHKSYVVNMDFIKVMEGESITLNSGAKIAITNKYAQAFNISYRNFVLKRINP